MSIQTKIGIILLCAVMGFGIAEYYVQQRIILPEFLSLEQEYAATNTRRVIDAFNNEIDHLKLICRDWAAWDDTYAFMSSRSESYIASNLPSTIFADNNLNLIHICDSTGSLVWGKVYDLNTETFLSPQVLTDSRGFPGHPFCGLIDSGDSVSSGVKGVLTTQIGPMMIAACPILRSDHSGPPAGIFIMGRLIDENRISDLMAQTHVDFSLIPLNTNPLPPEIEGIVERVSQGDPYSVDPVDSQRLNVYAVIPDLNGNAALLLRTNFSREIVAKGNQMVREGFYSLVIAGLLILLVLLFGIKFAVLNPVARLIRHALSIEQRPDFSKRMGMKRKDEIGVLAREFDRMVDRIEQDSRKLSEVNASLKEDIKIRMQAEAALRENEETFRSVVEQAGDAVFVNDMKGRFHVVNPMACERLGYDRDTLLQMTVMDIDPDYFQHDERIRAWLDSDPRKPLVFESRHQRKDGRTFPVEISASLIQYRGKRFVLTLVRDITLRRQHEERLREARKMEAICTLTAGISHNFNNILSIMLGSAELARLKIPQDSPIHSLIEKIETAGLRAKDMVGQLMYFSQASEEDMKPVFLSTIIAEAVSELAASIPEHIEIKTEIQRACRPVQASAYQIRLVLGNLWKNAVEAMSKKGGTLTVVLENLSIKDSGPEAEPRLEPGDYVKLSVKDTGPGMPPSVKIRIFDPYFSSKDFSKGAGLGLAVVHGIVKGHGGAINVSSDIDKGTRIDIFFPAIDDVSIS